VCRAVCCSLAEKKEVGADANCFLASSSDGGLSFAAPPPPANSLRRTQQPEKAFFLYSPISSSISAAHIEQPVKEKEATQDGLALGQLRVMMHFLDAFQETDLTYMLAQLRKSTSFLSFHLLGRRRHCRRILHCFRWRETNECHLASKMKTPSLLLLLQYGQGNMTLTSDQQQQQ
jgi:hypothetical protein